MDLEPRLVTIKDVKRDRFRVEYLDSVLHDIISDDTDNLGVIVYHPIPTNPIGHVMIRIPLIAIVNKTPGRRAPLNIS